jgi:hypothetical protein
MSASVLALVMQLTATSAQVTVVDGQELTVPVAPTGVTIQLPDFVRVVTPSADYSIKPLAPARPPPTRPANGAPAPAAAEPMDVRVFLVKALSATPQEQAVTFILTDSRSVTVRFLPGSARDDSFVDIHWMKRSTGAGARGKAEGFLAPERTLLMAMLHGEASYGRKLVNQKVELPGYPELEVTLQWAYEAPEGLVGGVYTLTNKAKKTVIVNPTVLAVGTPNRAVLTQMDHEELKACKDDDSPDPRGTGCTSLVRIVSRSAQTIVEPGTLAPERSSSMPFVLTPKEGAKR